MVLTTRIFAITHQIQPVNIESAQQRNLGVQHAMRVTIKSKTRTQVAATNYFPRLRTRLFI